MQAENAFPKLAELVREKRDNDAGLHRLLLELMYEMSRMQKLMREDLGRKSLRVSQTMLTCCSGGG